MGAPPPTDTPRSAATRRGARAARAILIAWGLAYVAAFIYVALGRMQYPFELEWMEGGTLDHLERVLHGERLYDEPSLRFAAFVYPPIYYWISALPAQLLGAGFAPLRLVSFAAALGSMALIYVWIRKETGRSFPGLMSACLYAAAFRPSGGWFDVARVDSLVVFLLLAALAAVRFGRSAPWLAAAGATMTLAVMTKQVAVLVSVPVAVYCLMVGARRGAWFVVTHVATLAGAVLALQWNTDGWFLYYILEVPARHQLLSDALVTFWTEDLFRPMPAACVLGIAALWLTPNRNRQRPRTFYLLGTAGLLAAAWSGRLHEGTYVNNLLPAYAALSVLFGLGIDRVRQKLTGHGVELAVCALCLLQFGKLTYTPHKRIPTQADAAAGRDIVRVLGSFEGDVLIPSHGYLARMAGKPSSIHSMAIEGFVTGGPSPITDRLLREIADAVGAQRFAAIVLDFDALHGAEDISATYDLRDTRLVERDAFWPVTGYRTRPRFLWVPQPK